MDREPGFWQPRSERGRPAGCEISSQDYLPGFQRYQQAVRQAVGKDAKEKNGQDVHAALERLGAVREKHGELLPEDYVDLLVGMLRAADCDRHQGACPVAKGAAEYIKTLIARLGMLRDLEHGRVTRALDYALGHEKYGKDLRRMYLNRGRLQRASLSEIRSGRRNPPHSNGLRTFLWSYS